jgi:hypothetical protein
MRDYDKQRNHVRLGWPVPGECGARTQTRGDKEMSVVTDTKRRELNENTKGERGPVAKASRRGYGLRAGLLSDWRAGNAKAPSEIAQRGKRLRDGRKG